MDWQSQGVAFLQIYSVGWTHLSTTLQHVRSVAWTTRRASRFCTSLHSRTVLPISISGTALRASGSSVEARMRQELQEMTGSDLSQITCVQIKPLPAGEETMTRPSVWAATNWYVNRYAQQPDWERVEALAGIYACHASEFNAPHFSDPMSIALWEWRRGPTWQSRCSATSAGHQSAHKRSIWTPRELCPLLQKEAD